MPFLASRRPVEPRKGKETDKGGRGEKKSLRRLARRERGRGKGKGGIPPLTPPFFKKRGAIFQALNLIKFLKNFVLVFCNVCAGVPQHLFDNFNTNN